MESFRYRPEILEDVPENLVRDLQKFEDWFTVDTAQLKHITDHFVLELEKGLTHKGGSIPMMVTWVMSYPSGHEEGRILTVDMGGTNLRICEVLLSVGKGEFEQTQTKYKLPEAMKRGTAEELWDFVAECLQAFIHEHHKGGQTAEPMPVAFTFSWPVDQKSIRNGVLRHWTKNFLVSGVEGHDVVPQLQAALEKNKVPARVVALINDTTGTLIASHYRDPFVKIGSIFSTGCNAAYLEECRLVPKLQGRGLPDDATVIINTEYGAFDNEGRVLPLNPFDRQLDAESVRPGTQVYEKMVAGLYIGEMLRIILVALHEQGKLFQGQDIVHLRQENVIEASFMSVAELDISEDLDEMRTAFKDTLSLEPALHELKMCRYLVGLIANRAARLYACGVAAICKKKNLRRCHIGVDGSLFTKYTGFKQRASQALRDILDWPPEELDLVALNAAEDGSGVGAALAGVLALQEDIPGAIGVA